MNDVPTDKIPVKHYGGLHIRHSQGHCRNFLNRQVHLRSSIEKLVSSHDAKVFLSENWRNRNLAARVESCREDRELVASLLYEATRAG